MPNKIERDQTFTRHYADAGFAYLVGTSVDIAFVQHGPSLIEDEVEGEEGASGITAEATRSEVCRIRLSPNGALRMSFDVLDELAGNRRASRNLIRRRLTEILSNLDELDNQRDAGNE